ncbi:hypothetical protein ASF62_10910 [Leifsonia sp. Leaf325]|nr:hypothetical protein [Leifsonia sp. Leaf325]KQQ94571.1 hypothetical protein ASF62_10910 [Leifsonia sp. Leaf325]
MYLADTGSQLLGETTAKLIRRVALFGQGIGLEPLAIVLGWTPEATAKEVDRLLDVGLLQAPEEGLISANRHSLYWGGVTRLLDTRLALEELITSIAQQLGGPGTRALLYGAPVVESRLYLPMQRLVLVCAPDDDRQKVLLVDEFKLMLDEAEQSMVISFEDGEKLAAILRTGDPAAIRSYLDADDIRAHWAEDSDEKLTDASREYQVHGGTGDAHRPPSTR